MVHPKNKIQAIRNQAPLGFKLRLDSFMCGVDVMGKACGVERVSVWFDPDVLRPKPFSCVLMEVKFDDEDNEVFYGYFDGVLWFGVMPWDEVASGAIACDEIHGDVVLWSYVDKEP